MQTIRSIASQAPRVAAAAAASHAPMSTMSTMVPQPRRLNPRLEVDLEQLSVMQCLDPGLTLIDVRQPAEILAQEQIPGSVNIPLGSLRGAFQLSAQEWQARFSTAKPSKADKAIVFYARGPIASGAAVEIAHRLGYKKSRHYVGGMEDYCVQNNLPLVKPRTNACDDPLQQHYNYHYYNPDLHYL